MRTKVLLDGIREIASEQTAGELARLDQETARLRQAFEIEGVEIDPRALVLVADFLVEAYPESAVGAATLCLVASSLLG